MDFPHNSQAFAGQWIWGKGMNEVNPPPGCWRLLLGFPVLLLGVEFSDPLKKAFLSAFPDELDANTGSIAFLCLLVAGMFASWMAVLKIADFVFGKALYPHGPNTKSKDTLRPSSGRNRRDSDHHE
jgi:hypothetical protein